MKWIHRILIIFYVAGAAFLFKTINEDPNFISWKTKEFVFIDTPLGDVVLILNNAYQSTLYLENENLLSCPVTVSFKGQSFEAILEVLKATLNLETQKNSSGIAISGQGC